MKPKTTIWQETDNGKTLIKELSGLPHGTPVMGQILSIPVYGEVICSGIAKSGTGASEVVTEIQLTVK